MIEFGIADYSILFCFLFFSIFFSYLLTRKNKKSLREHFQSGGKLSWFVSGTGMVATTFAADTPLAVTELVYQSGISGNWLWWYAAIGSVVTVYIFAPLWKRTGVTTDVEFIKLRYSGRAADFLRMARSIYLGFFLNILIMAWVNLAIYKILSVLFVGYPIEWFVSLLFLFAFLYTAIMGLSGISYADTFQFFFAMAGCIALAIVVVNLPEVGGLAGLKQKLSAQQLAFTPQFSKNAENGGMKLGNFLILVMVAWWASWYPGAEPGGGGYIAQRILAAKDERSSTLATLWFTIAHYFIRPWPWIIVALSALVLFPTLPAQKTGQSYIQTLQYNTYPGINGILLATFFAAYLSTIATHLNWGASYLIHDLYRPYIAKNHQDKHYLHASSFAQLIMMFCSLLTTFYLIDTISGVWKFLISGSAGVGFVLLARWFYWRINAWAEIAAFIFPLIFFAISIYGFGWQSGSYQAILFGTVGTIALCLLISYTTQPTEQKILENFYQTVRPPGIFWQKWAKRQNLTIQTSPDSFLRNITLAILGVFLVISGLFTIGYLLFYDRNKLMYSTIIFSLASFATWCLFPKAREK